MTTSPFSRVPSAPPVGPCAYTYEAPAKIRCHNLVVLLQNHHELGISATFRGDEPATLLAVAEPAEMWAWV